MTPPGSIVVVQTAFVGDVILTLPLFQLLRGALPRARITAVVIPAAAGLLAGHPSVDRVIVYDKRGADRGVRGLVRKASMLRGAGIDAALIPHRSLRSALLCRVARIPLRIGFDTSAGRMLLTHTRPYAEPRSEILRNLSLALPLGIQVPEHALPRLYPSALDRLAVDAFLQEWTGSDAALRASTCIAVAPGSVWNTKRWPESSFSSLIRLLLDERFRVVLIGGPADRDLCARLCASTRDRRVADASGRFSLLESAELIRRCAALVSNDSAPVHLASAVGVPVVAIFGPTLPAFGFAPAGPRDRIVETGYLACRPCSIHGGNRCPTGTFDCMNRISAARVLNELEALVHQEA